MPATAIFSPFIVMMALTLIVMIIMVLRRGADAQRHGMSISQIPPTRHRVAEQSLWSSRTQAAGDQLQNLFETPILFYGLCLALFAINAITPLALTLAWFYVGTRIAHALVHLTYNHVAHRFVTFVLSLLCLSAMMIIVFIRVLHSPVL